MGLKERIPISTFYRFESIRLGGENPGDGPESGPCSNGM